MAIRNFLVLSVFVYFGIHDLIQAEIIRGMDIPRLDVTRIVGKWYFLVTVMEDDRIACTTPIIEQKSADNFTINVIFTLTSVPIKKNDTAASQSLALIYCTMREDSNIIKCNNNEGLTMAMVVFDVDYNSFMAIYATYTEEAITIGTDGFILIIGRQPTLPDGIIEKVKQSSIYQQGVDSNNTKLISLNTSGCQ